MKKLQITDFELEKAIVLYKSGSPLRKLAKQVKLSEEGLRKLLEEKNVLRTKQESARGGKSKAIINDNALDILTPEAMYWIGFLYADGHIAKDRPRILLALSAIDKNHMQKFANFFGKDLNLMLIKGGMKSNGYISNDAYRVAFSSQKIYDRLISLGFTHRKTYESIPNDILKYSRDFWRGVIDGDGSIYINKGALEKYDTPTLNLSGNEETIICFLNYVKNLGIEVKVSLERSKISSVLCEVDLRAHDLVMNTLNNLYKDSTVYLDRKYEKYLEIINKNQQK